MIAIAFLFVRMVCDCFKSRRRNVAEFAHAYGEVLCRTTLGDLHLAPWLMHIEEDEKVDRPIALNHSVDFQDANSRIPSYLAADDRMPLRYPTCCPAG